jgi:hypothetical protein
MILPLTELSAFAKVGAKANDEPVAETVGWRLPVFDHVTLTPGGLASVKPRHKP